ncbi:DNA starvation/stationary phase protection protein [Psychromarinibacter sp. C21-152]|uniref:DNA starvation/stationary phase protection protein n=1 Tax=Psychromarinibacter sediminicola TaxID=3033385 RepID=A0AAE3NW26_9RHOB|nr:DNA starvation/stationary phase protection protein [Psychromarinibacter sediminicola]MDF0603336.1 DNA starvation/stationary phase protection protein [Psychromarinibacter sediminicola]
MTQTAVDLSTDAQAEICEALNQCVAETAVTTMLAQNFHWNVTGMAFAPLHELFQQIYEDHFAAQDDLAERVKALKGHANGVLAEMVKASKVDEYPDSKGASAQDMIKAMLAAQETLTQTIGGAGELAAKHGDTLTEDLCIERGRTHEKFAWFLRAHLDG